MKKFGTALTAAFFVLMVVTISVSASDCFWYNFSIFKGAGAQYGTRAQKFDCNPAADFAIDFAGSYSDWKQGSDWIYFNVHAYNGKTISQTFRTYYATFESLQYFDNQNYIRPVQAAVQYAADNPHYGASVMVFINP